MNQAGLHLLLTRSSCGLLQAPAPSGDGNSSPGLR